MPVIAPLIIYNLHSWWQIFAHNSVYLQCCANTPRIASSFEFDLGNVIILYRVAVTTPVLDFI